MKILIIGIGKLGAKLASTLSASNADVTVMDNDIDVLQNISDRMDVLTIHANGIEASALRELDVKSYDLAIASTGSDKNNIICCSMLKKMGCTNVIARIRDPEFVRQQAFIQENMQIDYAVNPELSTAREIIRFLTHPIPYRNTDFAEGQILIVNIPAEKLPQWWGIALKDMKMRDEGDFLITAIKRDGNIIIPDGQTVIKRSDILYIIGHTQKILAFVKKKMLAKKNWQLQRAMIIGGGHIGYYLANELANQNIETKVIDKDPVRCEYLTENLPANVKIICASGSDMELMENEGLSDMDAFIGVTGHDEENLLMTLMAKYTGVDRVVAKVSRSNYVNIIEQLGADAAFSTVDITASDILRYARGKGMLSLSVVLGGQAETVEFLIGDNPKIIGKPLSALTIPSGVVFASLRKKNHIIIPKGSTTLEPGDQLVAFCLPSMLPKLEKFIYAKKEGSFYELWNSRKNNR